MNHRNIKFSWLLFVLAAGLIVMTGCMTPKPKPGEVFTCVKDADLTKTIAKEASLETASWAACPPDVVWPHRHSGDAGGG